jgi:putative DNA primase/helicase
VFAGTTNQAIYLKDESGNRRYWPVRCGYVDLAELEADRDQLWAEAVELYRQRIPWHVVAEERDLFLGEAEARLVPDAYETKIVRFLESDPQVPYYTMADILERALNLEAGRWTRVEQTRVGQVMSRLDWPRLRAQVNHAREWYYVRPIRRGAKPSDPVDLEATHERLQRALNLAG